MVEKAALALSLALDRIAGLPTGFWFVLGFTLASIPATYLIIERYKKHRIKKDLEALGGHIMIAIVALASFLFALADFVISYATGLNAVGNFLPFWVQHGAAIMAGAVALREFTKALKEKRLRDAQNQIEPAIIEQYNRQLHPQSYPSDVSQVQPLQPARRSTDLFS